MPDLIIGILVGLVLAVIIGAVALYFVLRDTSPVLPPAWTPPSHTPAVTVFMLESFLNQQLRQALELEASETQSELTAATPAHVPFRFKINDAALDVRPDRRAEFTAGITVSAWALKLTIRPITDFIFVPHNGQVNIIVTRIRLSGITIPYNLIESFVQEVVETAQGKLNHSLIQLQADTGVELVDMDTTEDLLILRFSSHNGTQA